MVDKYIKSVHPNLVRYVAYMTGANIALHGFKLSEYDIQYFIYFYLNYKSGISEYSSEREKGERFDNSIYDNTSNKPIVVYELKTFIKPKEVIRDNSLSKDILKLARFLVTNPDVRAYYILVSTTKKVDQCINGSTVFAKRVLDERRTNNRKYTNLDLKLLKQYGTEPEDHKIKGISLRPSTKYIDNLITCYSWEVVVYEK